MVQEYLTSVREAAFLASVLAGFAVTIVIELISRGTRSKVASVATGAFILAAGTLLVTTVAFVLMIGFSSSPSGLTHPPSAEGLMSIGAGVGNLMFLGLTVFLVGIALVGWLHSKAIGILSSVTSASSLLVIVWLTLRLSGLGGS